MVYQCGIVEEFENTRDARMAHAVWSKSTANRRQAQVKRPDNDLQGIAHLRGLLVKGGVFSLPAELFDACRSEVQPVCGEDAMCRAVQAVLAPMSDCTFDRDSMRMFQVVNNRPENRCLVPLPHLDKVMSSINVTLCNVGAHQPEVNNLIDMFDADSGIC